MKYLFIVLVLAAACWLLWVSEKPKKVTYIVTYSYNHNGEMATRMTELIRPQIRTSADLSDMSAFLKSEFKIDGDIVILNIVRLDKL